MEGKHWYNYFEFLANKYNLSISQNKPIVIFLDGKSITSSYFFNLNGEGAGSFNEAFEKTVKYFTKKYNCLAIYGVDEVSFIFENSELLVNDLKLKQFKAHNINSIFSQKFFECFKNNINSNDVYWHSKISNIPEGKVKSYLKYRSTSIFELFMTYFLKRMGVKDSGRIVLPEKIKMCNSYSEYSGVKQFEKGHLYKNGELIDLEEFTNNDKIVKLPEINRENNSLSLEDEF